MEGALRIVTRSRAHDDPAWVLGRIETRLDAKPEPVCGSACPKRADRHCSRDCPEIPLALSDDPVRYPLEPGIAPLVYELTALGVFQTCWSCEGHESADGQLWKRPQVWFYADSQVAVRLLADCLSALSLSRELNAEWLIAVTFSDYENPATTFALAPNVGMAGHSLAALRQDARTIAARLPVLAGQRVRQLRSIVN
jgi:hypothetical protein